jgi:hypothetical protein
MRAPLLCRLLRAEYPPSENSLRRAIILHAGGIAHCGCGPRKTFGSVASPQGVSERSVHEDQRIGTRSILGHQW